MDHPGRRVTLGGITQHPTEAWMEQMARNTTDEDGGCLRPVRYLLHDRDAQTPALLSQPERLRRPMGTIGQRGMPVQADPLRGGLAEARSDRIHCALPLRAAAPSEGKRRAVPTSRAETDCRSAPVVCRGSAACSSTTPAQHE